MMHVTQWTGGLLIIVGMMVLAGYGIYFFSQDFFGATDIPLAVKIAVPSVVGGAILLLVAVVVQRIESRNREHFKEEEF